MIEAQGWVLQRNEIIKNMEKNLTQGVADYLNNKFGAELTMGEPWPDWMRQENEPMTDTKYKCLCDAKDDLLMQVFSEENEIKGNLVGHLRTQVCNDDEMQANVIRFYYEEV